MKTFALLTCEVAAYRRVDVFLFTALRLHGGELPLANEDASLLFTFFATCRIAAIAKTLHSKGAAFSSLPRRNAMKPGHLHPIPEKTYLLVPP